MISRNKSLFCLTLLASLLVASESRCQQVITDFSNFTKSGNMLNSASHNREQDFSVNEGDIIVSNLIPPTTGSAGQEIFGTTEFTSFLTDGFRLQVEFLNIDFQQPMGNTERIGLVTSSTVPAGGPASGDVRSAGDYFYWVYQTDQVRAGMFTSDGIEEEGGFVFAGEVGTDITGLYMERVGDAWDLGYLDGSGQDVFVQTRSTINEVDITTDGSVIGLYSDMRNDASVFELTNLAYGNTKILLGDVNCDGAINLLDVTPFVAAISNQVFVDKADINQDGAVNLLDIGPFIDLLTGN